MKTITIAVQGAIDADTAEALNEARSAVDAEAGKGEQANTETLKTLSEQYDEAKALYESEAAAAAEAGTRELAAKLQAAGVAVGAAVLTVGGHPGAHLEPVVTDCLTTPAQAPA